MAVLPFQQSDTTYGRVIIWMPQPCNDSSIIYPIIRTAKAHATVDAISRSASVDLRLNSNSYHLGCSDQYYHHPKLILCSFLVLAVFKPPSYSCLVSFQICVVEYYCIIDCITLLFVGCLVLYPNRKKSSRLGRELHGFCCIITQGKTSRSSAICCPAVHRTL
jgi:hypothetical protein